jgi:hypothetical protein
MRLERVCMNHPGRVGTPASDSVLESGSGITVLGRFRDLNTNKIP